MVSLLLVDNFDSFTFNIFHGLVTAGARVEVRRRDQLSLATIRDLRPDGVVLSPGPGRPEETGICLEIVKTAEWPTFGVCLGLQVLAVAMGGTVEKADQPVHGKVSQIQHTGQGCFAGLPSPLDVGRYHSLCVQRVPKNTDVIARTPEGMVMALRHRERPISGVQFHPDSFLSEQGIALFRNVVHGRL